MAIVGALPFNIQNGQLEDATPVMANFNFLASQVNSNAQPAGVLAEWVPSGLTPTFISATQFSVPGNVTATFTVKRRVLLTVGGVNGGATITASVFGAVTTVTVVTDTAAFLGAGLTAVSYGLLQSTILSTPKKTAISIPLNNSGAVLGSGTNYTFGKAADPWPPVSMAGDDFSEFNAATGVFTALQAGRYLVSFDARTQINGATISAIGQVLLSGSSFGTVTPINSAIAGQVEISFSRLVPLAAGGTVSISTLGGMFTFVGGPLTATGGAISITQVF